MALNSSDLADDIWARIIANLGTDIPQNATKANSQWYLVSKALAEGIVKHFTEKGEVKIVFGAGAFVPGPAGAPTTVPPLALALEHDKPILPSPNSTDTVNKTYIV